MNERAAKIGNQVKQAYGKVRDNWKAQEPARKKRIIFIAVGLVVLAVVLVVILNAVNGRYVTLYEGMSQDDQVKSVSVLSTAGVSYRVNDKGDLEVPQNQLNQAMAQLAMQGLPSVTLNYNVFGTASGLTTTDLEKRQILIHQMQDRLQDTFKTWEGVQNAYVTLNINNSSNKVWDVSATKNSGSVSFTMAPGYVLSAGQVQAVRHTVGASAGIDATDVVITDSNGNLLAGMGQEYDVDAAATLSFLERMGLEAEFEAKLGSKIANILALSYEDPEDYAVSVTAELDTDRLVKEIKTYFPLEGTIHGVVSEEELQALMGAGDFAEGVVGETDNTDVPIYVDINGDGVLEAVDYARYRDYAVSYALEQWERDGPKVADVSVAVGIKDAELGTEGQQSLRTTLAAAANVPVENLVVQAMLPKGTTGQPGPGPGEETNTILGIPLLYWLIAAAALVVLILVLVFVLVLRAKGRKKRLLAEQAEAEAEALEAERIQAEIEERKKQLKSAALGDPGEDAITNEVRDFARANPEITANLLRNWLKEGD